MLRTFWNKRLCKKIIQVINKLREKMNTIEKRNEFKAIFQMSFATYMKIWMIVLLNNIFSCDFMLDLRIFTSCAWKTVHIDNQDLLPQYLNFSQFIKWFWNFCVFLVSGRYTPPLLNGLATKKNEASITQFLCSFPIRRDLTI